MLLPDLPTIKSAADLAAAVGAIVQAVVTGRLTSDEEEPDPFPKDRGGRPKLSA